MARMKKETTKTLKQIHESVKSLSLNDIKNKYPSIYNKHFKEETNWIQQRGELIKQLGLDKIVTDIQSLDDSLKISNSQDVENFLSKIDNIYHLDNFIKNIRTDNGIIIDRVKLLTYLKNATKSEDVETIINKNIVREKLQAKNIPSAILNLFSIIKSIQKPDEYPVNYKRWIFLLKKVFGINAEKNYNVLCDFYKNAPILPEGDTRRDLCMSVYMNCIIDLIAQNIEKEGINDSALSKQYRSFIGRNDIKQEEKVLENEKLEGRIEEKGNDDDSDETNKQLPLNLILYGPPGTGKTYNTINKALEIVLNENETKELNMNADEAAVEAVQKKNLSNSFEIKHAKEEAKRKVYTDKFKELKKKGRIEFITFHQSMSYEEFVEGIKPIPIDKGVSYEVKPGIFKQICERASSKTTTIEQALTEFIKEVDKKGSNGYQVPYYKSGGHFTIHTNSNKQSFKVTGLKSKTKTTQSATFDNIKEYYSTREKNKNTYVECIVNLLEDNYLKHEQAYVLIIDEINRGNVSQIFGELITLIEEDKRLGNREELTVKLPYSSTCKSVTTGESKEEEFGVPNNLYIIGTMNTADRSVEALDTALRRRFSFEEMMPDYNADGMFTSILGNSLRDILWTINQRIQILKGREQQIGHSYLMKCKNEEDVKAAFKEKIVPLLQEYFYGDYSQIALILGEGFVKKETEKVPFATTDNVPDTNTRYRLLTDEEWKQKNFSLLDVLERMNIQECQFLSAQPTTTSDEVNDETGQVDTSIRTPSAKD